MVHKPFGTLDLIEGPPHGDLMVVNAARVSHGNFTSIMRPEDEGLIGYLMKNKHGTPFEHNIFIFHVKAPIFVFREWHRHRIGVSINEMSGRYTELRPEFYYPDNDHCRKQVGKPGAYTYEAMMPHEAESMRSTLKLQYERAYAAYTVMLKEGVAKEVARLCLPVAIYSEMYWTCNARSLMAFLELRNAPTAQREIKDYAQVMEDIFLEEMPVTAKAFIDNGRIAP